MVGDRAYALVDTETGKVASAKHPKLWPNLFACRAARNHADTTGSAAGTGTTTVD